MPTTPKPNVDALRRLVHALARTVTRHHLLIALLALPAFAATQAAEPARPPQAAAIAPEPPRPIDIPAWFHEGFLDFKEEVAAAAAAKKQLLVYFGQDGCPYCRELMTNNFSQKAIVEQTRAHFVAIALNLWGDRELQWIDGRTLTEKQLAKALQVQFTPTLLFIDGQGRVVTRLNGYHPPRRFAAVLDYVASGAHARGSLADYLAARPELKADAATPAGLVEQPFLMKPPHDLRRRPGGKPLAVLFETRGCEPCTEMHRQGFARPELQALLVRFDVARFALTDPVALTGPRGEALKADAWARQLGIHYTPTLVFFDAAGAEVFRVDGYTRPFHLASAFDYVASGAYRSQPEFQRYIQARADARRAQGQTVDLWK